MTNTKPVLTVYIADESNPDMKCVQCNATKNAVNKARLKYPELTAEYIEVKMEDDETRKFLAQEYKAAGFPVVVNNQEENDFWSGFRPDNIKRVAAAL